MSKLEVLTQVEEVCSYKAQQTLEPRLTRGRKKNLEKASEIQNKPPPKSKKVPVKENIENVSHHEDDINQEIKKITNLVKNMKVQQKNFNNKVNFIENHLHGSKNNKISNVNCTDEQKRFHKLKFLTVILMSMMFDADKKIIGFEKLLKLLQAYRFGLREVQLELTSQGCKPTLKVISSIEKMMENPVEDNLREFLFVYKHCSDKGKIYKIKKIWKYGRYVSNEYSTVLIFCLVILCALYSWFIVLVQF